MFLKVFLVFATNINPREWRRQGDCAINVNPGHFQPYMEMNGNVACCTL